MPAKTRAEVPKKNILVRYMYAWGPERLEHNLTRPNVTTNTLSHGQTHTSRAHIQNTHTPNTVTSMSSTHISTYHCICSEVLFASTRPLTEFATRQSDHAAICTIINSSSNISGNSNSNHSSNSAGKEEEEEERKEGQETKMKNKNNNNSILLSNAIAIERKEKGKEKEKEEDFPCLILKLDDGFEKRYPVQCPRCGVCFAYQLDGSQWVEDGNEKEKEKDDDVRRTGRRCDVLYVLREGLVRTEDVAVVGGGGGGS